MQKVALIIGHNKHSKGAFSKIVGYEYDYWKRIAEKIKCQIPQFVDVYERKNRETYSQEMEEILLKLNTNSYKYCVELHFNAGSAEARGCECLTKLNDRVAQDIGVEILKGLSKTFNQKIRAVILIKNSNQRGGYGVSKSKNHYILLEAFFGTNPDEALKFSLESEVVDFFVRFISTT